jgi:hypothetical protein
MVFRINYNITYSSSLYTKSSIRTVNKIYLNFSKRKFLNYRISKYDNINSHVISIDVKLRKSIQRSNRLSTLLPTENIPIIITMGYLKVKISFEFYLKINLMILISMIISQVIDVFILIQQMHLQLDNISK